MRTLVLFFRAGVLLFALFAGCADVAGAAGPGAAAIPPGHGFAPPPPDDCSGGILYANHNGNFESAYAWTWYHDPYVNAFGESYDLGMGQISCGAFWLTTIGEVPPAPTEVYVWDGNDPPGAVLAMVQGVQFQNLPVWPEFGVNLVPISLEVTRPFTIGYWSGFDGEPVWYIGADLDGFGGTPWTYAICGDYPDWCRVDYIWGPTQSIGIGVYFHSGPTPVEASSWGRIKSLY